MIYLKTIKSVKRHQISFLRSHSPNNVISTKYNTSIKNNLSDINYENLIAEWLNNIVTTFDYLNENDKDKIHI